MSRVSIEDLEVACEWLWVNEGEAGERESCQRVHDWIKTEIEDREIRMVARATGMSLGSVRRKLAQSRSNTSDPLGVAEERRNPSRPVVSPAG
jgi:hypothetical protein